jgi:pyruvate/2-oxoglutarate/acetoin dehydrogenase E1 component
MSTCAQSINKALDEVLAKDESVYLIGEDIRDPYGGAFKITKGLSSKYSERVLNAPISEAGITGLAAGMAMRGLRPVLEIMFGDFLSLAADQILTNISKLSWMYNGQISLPLVIRTPMGGRRGYGPTHSQCIEKMFLGIPGIKIIAPSYLHDVGSLLKTAIADQDPVLFIECKLDYPRKLRTPDDGQIDEWFVRVSEGHYPTVALSATDFEDDQVTVVTYGGITSIVLDALSQLLYEEEIASEVVVPSIIKPFGVIEQIIPSTKKTGRVVVVEEGTLTCGWGAEMATLVGERAFKYLKTPVRRIAARDFPIANAQSLEAAILPDKGDIIAAIKDMT